MKTFCKLLFSLIALAVAAAGILLLLQSESDAHQYVTIYDDTDPGTHTDH